MHKRIGALAIMRYTNLRFTNLLRISPRVTDVKSLGRLRSSSSSTLVLPVTLIRLVTLADGRPGMKRSTRLRHNSANRLIILHCVEDLSVLQNFLTLKTHVMFLTL